MRERASRCRPRPTPIAIGTGEILQECGRADVPKTAVTRARVARTRETAASGSGRVALIGYGSGVGKALEAAEELKGLEIAVTVADARFAKPIDAGLMAQLAAEHDLLVTSRRACSPAGSASAVWETLNETGATPRILRVGLPDRYVTHGKPALLHEEVGFTGKRIAERVAAAIADGGHGRAARATGSRRAGSAIVGA